MEAYILLIIGLILFVLGISFLLIIFFCNKYYNGLYKRCSSTTEGVYISIDTRKQDPTDMNNIAHEYYPIYQYVIEGKEYYVRGNFGSYSKNKVNTSNKTVYYNPNNPEESYTDRKTIDTVIKLFKILGIVFCIIGLILIVINFAL